MTLTETSSIKDLRQAIYVRFSLQNLSSSYRSQKLRKVCNHANGLDLRRKSDVIYLARQLNIIPHPMLATPFVTDGQRAMVDREFSRIRNIDFSAFFSGVCR